MIALSIKESAVEKYFREQVEIHLDAETRKYKTRRNDPDRIILFNGGITAFVETKRPGKEARAGQEREHNRLRAKGFDVEVINTKELVDDWICRHKQEIKSGCPVCGSHMILLPSLSKKICPECDTVINWKLAEGQKPLISCQR